jgi:cytochrome c556
LIPRRGTGIVRGSTDTVEAAHDPRRRNTMSGKRILLTTAAVVAAIAVSAAAMTATEAIKDRQKDMEGILDQMKTLAAIAKKQEPFDAVVVKNAATTIADHLEKASKLFPEGSATGDVQTWAKPEIWTDREHFDTLLENAHEAAVELGSVTEAEAFPPALGKLGNACKSCHDTFRLPKN